MTLPKICVIIPCRGGEETLEKCLRSVLAVEYANREIVVVDDGIDASARGMVRSFGNDVILLESPRRGPSYARTLAAGWTDACYIAFTDSDCIVPRDWLIELKRGFELQPAAVSCGGRQEIPRDASLFERRVFAFMLSAGMVTDYARPAKDAGVVSVGHNPSCNVMYKREAYLKAGGFLQGLWPGEDVEFDHRLRKAKNTIVFNPAATVYHYKPKTLDRFCRMMYRYGWAQGVLVRRYGMFRKVHWFPVVTLAWFAAAAVNPGVAIMVLVGGVLSAAIVKRSVWFVILAAYTAVLWNVGFVVGILKKTMRS